MTKQSPILVTGAAGFIGFHLSKKLLDNGNEVVGLDNMNDYYDVTLKKSRLMILMNNPGFTFLQLDLKDKKNLDEEFQKHTFKIVINLAAQAGVGYSITNPYAYLDSNLIGFLNVLEACRHHAIQHLIYASSSSVYGANKKVPFSVHDHTDHPLALYAASKKANELMAHAYANLYHLPSTGLRFFSAYGPYGRPDMALFIFTQSILEGKPINVYNFGRMKRDFTYIDDIVSGIIKIIPRAPASNKEWNPLLPDPGSSFAPYRIFNIGNNRPVELLHFIEVLEKKLGVKAIKNFLPLQHGDVEESCADIRDLENMVGYKPTTSVDEGIGHFVNWFREYYHVHPKP